MHKAPHPRVRVKVFLGRARLSLRGQLAVQRRHSSSGCVQGTRLELARWIFSALCGFQCVRKTNWATAARRARGPLPVVPPIVEKVSVHVWTPSPVVPSSHSGEKMCLVPDSGGSLDRGNTSRPHKPQPSDAIVCVSRVEAASASCFLVLGCPSSIQSPFSSNCLQEASRGGASAVGDFSTPC